MSFLTDVAAAAFPQLQQAESTATEVAYAVAIWGLIVSVELGVLIYFAAKRR